MVRADRLVAVLLFLQRRPNGATAAEVAHELEISERTARRDLESLVLAGLPVYSAAGRGGGWRLLGGGSIDLTGLTAPEMRALFALAGPRAAGSPTLKAAVRKLTRALPEPLRDDAEALTRSIIVEPGGWRAPLPERADPPFLDQVQHAVIRSLEVELSYESGQGASTTRVVQPLGLAMKGAQWYLVADTAGGRRTFRVDRMTDVAVTNRPFRPPADFVLSDAWQAVVDHVGSMGSLVSASIVVKASAIPNLRRVMGERLRIGPSARSGWVRCDVTGWAIEELAVRLAGFGDQLHVDEPVALRSALVAVGRQLVATYAPDG